MNGEYELAIRGYGEQEIVQETARKPGESARESVMG